MDLEKKSSKVIDFEEEDAEELSLEEALAATEFAAKNDKSRREDFGRNKIM